MVQIWHKNLCSSGLSLYSFKLHSCQRCFLICAAHSQHPNVCESHWIKRELMFFIMNHFPYLWGILNSFLNKFTTVLFTDLKLNEAETFVSIMEVDALILLYVTSCKMLHFVIVWTNQNKKCKQTLELAEYGLEDIFKARAVLR